MLSPFGAVACVGASAIGVAGLAAGGCAYAAMWPASQIFGHTLIAPRRPDELAITFDDGPNPLWTPQLLDVLGQGGVKATFFLVGSYVHREPVLVRRIVDEGHLVGNHSWSHPNLALTSAARVREELQRTREVLEQITGRPVRYFRPPFGARRPAVLRAAREQGLTPVMWNAMTDDWKEPSEEKIARRLIQKIDRLVRRGFGGNIVLHDGSHNEPRANRMPSVSACGKLIEHYKSTHRFVTLDAWPA
jgi:peptidoglycan/xylan/chitin deacetylase (PgdA/CDA1 family)